MPGKVAVVCHSSAASSSQESRSPRFQASMAPRYRSTSSRDIPTRSAPGLRGPGPVEVEPNSHDLAAIDGADRGWRVFDQHAVSAGAGAHPDWNDDILVSSVNDVLDLKAVALIRLQPVAPALGKSLGPSITQVRDSRRVGYERDVHVRGQAGGQLTPTL